ncbi:MAG: hypothetical protein KH225_05170 [Proteobacteria bacterium]|uniref:hypothetical protein n=1 Tax=Parasutterella excrementihominis TaxID=487175 RepID=UPI003AB5C353|nr:hypothetical protein [Pseudomonadota bacterium]
MTSFREMLQDDVDSVFLNEEEFAEIHEINGKKIKCVIDKDIRAALGNSGEAAEFLGVFRNTLTVFINAKEMSPPKAGSRFAIDGSLHLVVESYVEDGMLKVVAQEVLS